MDYAKLLCDLRVALVATARHAFAAVLVALVVLVIALYERDTDGSIKLSLSSTTAV